jgi:hypothetical protein
MFCSKLRAISTTFHLSISPHDMAHTSTGVPYTPGARARTPPPSSTANVGSVRINEGCGCPCTPPISSTHVDASWPYCSPVAASTTSDMASLQINKCGGAEDAFGRRDGCGAQGSITDSSGAEDNGAYRGSAGGCVSSSMVRSGGRGWAREQEQIRSGVLQSHHSPHTMLQGPGFKQVGFPLLIPFKRSQYSEYHSKEASRS